MKDRTESWALWIDAEPDIPRIARLHGLTGLQDDDVVRAAQQLRCGQGLSETLPAHLMAIRALRVAGFDEQEQLQNRAVEGEADGLALIAQLPAGISLLLVDEASRDLIHARALVRAAPVGALLPRMSVLASRKGVGDARMARELLRLAASDEPVLALLELAQHCDRVDGLLAAEKFAARTRLLGQPRG